MSATLHRVALALRSFNRETGLLRPDSRLLVAYSGGQDSTCLLHALAALPGALRPVIVAAHVDHGLRPEAASEAIAAAENARGLGADQVEVRRVDVRRYHASLRRASLEQAARNARYQLLAVLAAETGAQAVLLAHTRDDQAETVLLNLVRGAGLEGLAAMRTDERVPIARYGPAPLELGGLVPAPPSHLRLARPLLRAVERATTGQYCGELHLPIVEDRSNRSLAFARNRVRLTLMPALERVAPSARASLARLAELAADDAAVLEALARERWQQVAIPLGADAVRLDRAAFQAQPRAVQRRLLRLAIRDLTGSLQDVSARAVEDALGVLLAGDGPSERTYALPRGLTLLARGNDVVLRRAAFSSRIARAAPKRTV